MGNEKKIRFVRRKNIERALEKLGYDKSCEYQGKNLFKKFRIELNNEKLKQIDPGALPIEFVVDTLVNDYGLNKDDVLIAFGAKELTSTTQANT